MGTSRGSIDLTSSNPTKKTKQSRKTETFLDPTLETGVPSARNDIAVPYLIGRQLIESPNTIWNGPPRTTITTIEQKPKETYVDIFGVIGGSLTHNSSPGTTSTSKGSISLGSFFPEQESDDNLEGTVTVEKVESRFDFALGICLGPGVNLMAIYDDNRNKIWKADSAEEAVAPDDESTITKWVDGNVVNKMTGSLKFYSGSWNQPKDPTIVKYEGDAKTPAFRGFSYAVFNDAIISKDETFALPYGLDVFRTPDLLELGGDNTNPDRDVNIATALYEILTSQWSLLGVPKKYIDVDSFVAAGRRLADENNFCTVYITQLSQAKNILGVLSDQAYGALRWDAFERKVNFILFRDDYEIDDLPVFNQDNLEDVTNMAKDHWITLPKSIQVEFRYRKKFYEPMPAIVGLSKGDGENGGRSDKLTFETIRSPQTALKVAAREFARAGSPMLAGDLHSNRDGSAVLPGDLIAVDWPEIYPGKIPFRVTKTKEKGALFDTTTLTVEQAITPIINTAYGEVNDLASSNNGLTAPGAVDNFAVPLYFARFKSPSVLPPATDILGNVMYPFITARDGSPQFRAVEGSTDTAVVPLGFLVTTAKLAAPIDKMDGYTTGILSSITVDADLNWERFDTTPSAKTAFFKIGNELFKYATASDGTTGVSLTSVERGLVDTVAEDHEVGAEVIFFGNFDNVSSYGFDVDEGNVSLDIFAFNGSVISPDSTPLNFPTEQRANLPACPQNGMLSLSAGANSYPRTGGPQPVESFWFDYYVSWRRRDYLATAYTERSDDRPASGTTYTLTLRTPSNIHTELATGVSGNEVLVSIPVGFPLGPANIEIKATNANGDSAFVEFIAVTVVPHE